MALEAYLIYVAVILLLGTLASALAYQLKTSNVFFLILTGMIFGSFGMIEFPPSAILTISTIALILVVFDSSNKFSVKEFMKHSVDAFTLSMIFLVFNIFFMTLAVHFLFRIDLLISLLFAALVYGIDPMIALVMFKDKQDRAVKILKLESIINTPMTIILVFMVLSLFKNDVFHFSAIATQVVPIIQQIILGLGVGVIIGLIVVLVLKHNYMGDLSHLTLMTSAIIAYVFAEYIQGNGVLAITTFGIIFGNTRIHHKVELENFASIFSYTLEILVFILMGTFLIINPGYILFGTLLFILYLLVRLLAVAVAFPSLNRKEKMCMTLNVPKGIDVAIIVLILISQFSGIPGMDVVINLAMIFILYSIVLSTAVGTLIGGVLSKPKRRVKT